ncbi:MAG: DUF3341 domain-containing protein [Armatimonadota bacterium]|nr:DUF3341 domain-containing protein [Armatimonadota bacterium]
MPETLTVRAQLDRYEDLERVLRALKESTFNRYEAYGPTNLVELEDLMPEEGSWVRGWSTSWAIVGLVSFWLMCVLSALIYNLIVGGKPPWSNIPFVIPAYEGTILIGSIAAFLATIGYARLGRRRSEEDRNKTYTGDSYGVVVKCDPSNRDEVIDLLTNAGAADIQEERREL